MRFLIVALSIVGMIALAPAAAAQSAPDILTTITVDRIASMLKEAGYPVQIVAGRNLRVQTKMGEYNVAIFLLDCDEKGCSSIQFYAPFAKSEKFSLKYVNQWNQETRYAKAYINAKDGVSLEYDVRLVGGVTYDSLKQELPLFEHLVIRLGKFEVN